MAEKGYNTPIERAYMTKEEIQKQVEQIETIYKSYLDQLLELKKKQDKIISNFSEALKNKKLDELRKKVTTYEF